MRKNRVSITLTKEILDRLETKMLSNPLKYRSRSDAIEQILREQLIEELTVVILAGGPPDSLILEGTNYFRPIAKLDKDLTLIENIIHRCRDANFKDFVVVGTEKEGGTIPAIFNILSNGSPYRVSIRYLAEKRPLGTARTLEVLRDQLSQDFLMVPCDAYFDFSVTHLFDFHRKNNATCTLAVYHRTDFTGDYRGVVEMDGSLVVSHVEHPDNPRTHLVGTLIACLSPRIFDYIPPGNAYWSLQEDIFPRLIEEEGLFGYLVPGNWVNVHTKKDLSLAQRLFKEIMR